MGLINTIAENAYFDYDIFVRYFICLFICLLLYLPVQASETDCTNDLKKGKTALENARYKEAIELLSKAVTGCPLLTDYALLWLSEAYLETGNYEESLKTIRTLLNTYTETPLKERARIQEITVASKISEGNIEQLYESYILDYPKDHKIKYLYAKMLKQTGKADKAKEIFKELYISAGSYASAAYDELNPDDIIIEDIIERASNLIDRIQFNTAEAELRRVLVKDDGKLKNQILKKLGFSLFRQKRYREAAEVFAQTNERYWEIRSLYRAGEKAAVNSSVKEMLEAGDKRMASILISIATDMRRENKIEDALTLYQNVIEKYPTESEDALWGVGWTYYLTGEYKKASDIFTKLYDTYGDPRYMYWIARSIEAIGGDPKTIYVSLTDKERNFYRAMSYAKARQSSPLSEHEIQQQLKDEVHLIKNPLTLKKNERIETLYSFGFSKEALTELIYLSKSPDSIDDVLYACNKFIELKEYKQAVRLAVKIPYSAEMHQYLYPFAFREIIEKLSKKYDIDPLIVLSIIREESRFDPEAISPAGALGLMQLMPFTARRFDSILKLDIKDTYDILDIEKNLHIGIFYLNSLIKEFGSYAYAIAAYNAGEETVKRWVLNAKYKSVDEFIEDIPYIETKNYVKRVLNTFFEYAFFSPSGVNNKKFPLEKL